MPEIPPPRAPGRAESRATNAASASQPLSAPARLARQPSFQPCPAETDDELFANGIFEFNITRMKAFIDAHPQRFPIDCIAIADIPDFGESGLTEAAIRAAELSRPVLLAEIAPGHYNLIDGNHRVARARRDGVPAIPVRRVASPAHVPFLTSTMAYEKYVEYWNGKIVDAGSGVAVGRRKRT